MNVGRDKAGRSGYWEYDTKHAIKRGACLNALYVESRASSYQT